MSETIVNKLNLQFSNTIEKSVIKATSALGILVLTLSIVSGSHFSYICL